MVVILLFVEIFEELCNELLENIPLLGKMNLCQTFSVFLILTEIFSRSMFAKECV